MTRTRPAANLRGWARRRILRGLAATAALLAIIGGVPWALLQLTEWPITGLPTLDQLRDLPTHAASEEAIIGVFVVGLWATWALFCVSVLTEAAGEIRGRDTPHLPAVGPLQRSARTLVASIAMSLGPLTHTTTSAAVASPPIHHSAALPPAPITTAPPTPTLADSWEEITVGPDDTAWDIADRRWGDGLDAQKLWEANQHRTQPDGQRWTHANDPLRPGWTLQVPAIPDSPTVPPAAATMPAAAPVAPVEQAPLAPATTEVLVEPGEHFWGIAEQHLQQAWGRPVTAAEIAPYWRATLDLNADRIPPPGDPNLIHPGERYELPPTPSDPTSPPVPAPSPAPTPAPTPEPAAPPTTATPTDTTAPDITPTTTAPPATTAPAAPVADPAERDDDLDADEPVPVIAVAATATLAALVLAALARRRRARRRAALPGSGPRPRPVEDLQTEHALAVRATDIASRLQRLHHALAAALAPPASAPTITGVVLRHNGDIEVHTRNGTTPPAPFTPGPQASTWLLAANDATPPSPADPAPLLETLVALGTTPGGDWILVDLESLGALWIDGDIDTAENLARSIVAELAYQPLDHLLTLTVAGLDDLPQIPEHPIRHVEHLTDDIVTTAATNATHTGAHLQDHDLDTTLDGRVHGLTRDSLVATVVVAGPDEDQVLLDRLITATVDGAGLAVVAASPQEPLGPDATRVTIDGAGQLHIPHLELTCHAAGLDPDELQRLGDLLRREPDTIDTPSRPPAVAAVDHQHTGAYQPPIWKLCVRIFADHIVVTPDGDVVSFREDENPNAPHKNTRRGPELITYLALQPDRAATQSAIRDSLWWARSISAASVTKLLHGARAVLGGPYYLSLAVGDHNKLYRLSPDIVTDVELLTHALTYAQGAAATDPHTAIEVLGGHLAWIKTPAFRSDFLGQGLSEWAAANRIVDRVEQPLITAALLFADLLDDQGAEALTKALWGLDQALLACPTNEGLIRRAMTIDARLGAPDSADHRYRALTTELARDELEPQDETAKLRAQIMSRRSHTG